MLLFLKFSASSNPQDLIDIQELLRQLFTSMARMMATASETIMQAKVCVFTLFSLYHPFSINDFACMKTTRA